MSSIRPIWENKDKAISFNLLVNSVGTFLTVYSKSLFMNNIY